MKRIFALVLALWAAVVVGYPAPVHATGVGIAFGPGPGIGAFGASCSNFGSTVLQFGQDNKADAVAGGHTLTANGSAQWDTAQMPTGLASSVLFEGTEDYISSASSDDWAFPADFAVELRVRFSSVTGNQMLVQSRVNGGFSLSLQGGVLTVARDGVANDLTYSWSPSANTWYAIAVTRTSGTMEMYVDGTRVATGAVASSYGAGQLNLGENTATASWDFFGWMAGVRITKGSNRGYTGASYTVPALPLVRGSADTYWAYVTLLALQENGADASTTFRDYSLYDQSTRDHVLTAAGNAQYDTAQAPTGLTSSLLLDGTGDYFSAPDSADWLLDADFTIEGFVYPTASTAQATIIGQWSGSTGTGTLAWALTSPNDTTRQFRFLASTDSNNVALDYNSGVALSLNAWSHVAVARSGSSVYLFVNGTQAGTTQTLSGSLANASNVLSIGATSAGTQTFTGNLAGFRITKGVARYTSNFTAPSLPYCTGYPVATGGTITTAGNFKIHSFTSSGTFTVSSGAGGVEYLVVAGGGAGGSGGGGAGGYRTNSAFNHAVTAQAYSITVGAGGTGWTVADTDPPAGVDGSNSVFDSITSTGGGGGGGGSTGAADGVGRTGGSGGGGGARGEAGTSTGGAGTAGQGSAGGSTPNQAPSPYAGSGGGGASAVGTNGNAAGDTGGNGGAGTATAITGTWATYAGGGGGGVWDAGGVSGGSGGAGGGGAGGNNAAGTAGTANTGGGGGGGGPTTLSGNGGSGIVIVKYKFQFHDAAVYDAQIDTIGVAANDPSYLRRVNGW